MVRGVPSGRAPLSSVWRFSGCPATSSASAGAPGSWPGCSARLQALARAIDRSPFHAARLAGIGPARFELADLARLQVMTKAQMMEHFDEVVTDRRLTPDPSRSTTPCAQPPTTSPG
jgi:hypothetical protein